MSQKIKHIAEIYEEDPTNISVHCRNIGRWCRWCRWCSADDVDDVDDVDDAVQMMQQTQCTAWWKGHRASARSLPAINLCNLCKNIQKYSNADIEYFSNIRAKLFHFRPWLQIIVGYLCKKFKPCKNIQMLEWLQILCLHRSICKVCEGKTDEKHNHSNNELNETYHTYCLLR